MFQVTHNSYRSKYNQYEIIAQIKQNEYTDNKDWGMEYLTFPGLSQLSGISHLFSTRLGGSSEGIFATMNLSFTRGDEKEAVLENYKRIAAVLKTDIECFVCSDQTHTTNVRVVTKDDLGKGVTKDKDYADVDGLITNQRGVVLSTFYADCVPLYLVDPKKEVIGLSHSGWRGTVNQMGRVTIEKMHEEFGCQPKDIHVAIGPSICQACYEVSQEVYDAYQHGLLEQGLKEKQVNERMQKVFMQKNERQIEENKYQMDLWKANELIFIDAGILPEHLEITSLCTSHNKEYLFSHRASNGRRGNLGAFLMLNDRE